MGIRQTGGAIYGGIYTTAYGLMIFSEASDLATATLTGKRVATFNLSGGPGSLVMKSGGLIGWSSSATDPEVSSDLLLARDAADILAQRRGVNPQAFRLYNTFTDASNYERVNMGWSGNVFHIFPEAAGTGTIRTLTIGSPVSTSVSNTIVIDPAVGTSGGTKQVVIRVVGIDYFNVNNVGGTFTLGSNSASGRPTAIRSTSSGIIIDTLNGGGFIEMSEQTAPAAGAVNTGRLYLEDNGSGKTRLMIRFNTGAAQQIAIEP